MRAAMSSLDHHPRTLWVSSSPTTRPSIGKERCPPRQHVAPPPHPSGEHRRFRAVHVPRIS
ncbi:hypothetical protein BD309DRAFT_969378 [Dichomitus squalens]|nr:hypothetical protein BD309DRAFT_969378 [Dichomitus squalens]